MFVYQWGLVMCYRCLQWRCGGRLSSYPAPEHASIHLYGQTLFLHVLFPTEAGMRLPHRWAPTWESGGFMWVWSASRWWPSTCTSRPLSCHLPCRSGTMPGRSSTSGAGRSSTEVREVLNYRPLLSPITRADIQHFLIIDFIVFIRFFCQIAD